MTPKEIFLSIKSYDEFDKLRDKLTEKLKGIDWSDSEVRNHIDVIFEPLNDENIKKGIIIDVNKEKPAFAK